MDGLQYTNKNQIKKIREIDFRFHIIDHKENFL
jgi:hypothetical protein